MIICFEGVVVVNEQESAYTSGYSDAAGSGSFLSAYMEKKTKKYIARENKAQELNTSLESLLHDFQETLAGLDS